MYYYGLSVTLTSNWFFLITSIFCSSPSICKLAWSFPALSSSPFSVFFSITVGCFLLIFSSFFTKLSRFLKSFSLDRVFTSIDVKNCSFLLPLPQCFVSLLNFSGSSYTASCTFADAYWWFSTRMLFLLKSGVAYGWESNASVEDLEYLKLLKCLKNNNNTFVPSQNRTAQPQWSSERFWTAVGSKYYHVFVPYFFVSTLAYWSFSINKLLTSLLESMLLTSSVKLLCFLLTIA